MEDQGKMHLYNKYFNFLDALRESGITNMFGAAPYLREQFPELNKKQSHEILSTWMKNTKEI